MNKCTSLLSRYLAYVAMTLVPLLLGWGVGDVAGFIHDRVRAIYIALIVCGAMVVFVPRLNVRPFAKGKQVVGRGLMRAYMVSGYVLLVFLPFADRRGILTFADGGELRWAGLALSLVGSTIRLAGLWSLGRQFSGWVTLQEGHELVQEGVYQYLRHPMYLGFVLATAGLVLVFRSWLVFPALIWNLVFVFIRIQQEEHLLGQHFGTEFEAYQRRTWRLLPYVY